MKVLNFCMGVPLFTTCKGAGGIVSVVRTVVYAHVPGFIKSLITSAQAQSIHKNGAPMAPLHYLLHYSFLRELCLRDVEEMRRCLRSLTVYLNSPCIFLPVPAIFRFPIYKNPLILASVNSNRHVLRSRKISAASRSEYPILRKNRKILNFFE